MCGPSSFWVELAHWHQVLVEVLRLQSRKHHSNYWFESSPRFCMSFQQYADLPRHSMQVIIKFCSSSLYTLKQERQEKFQINIQIVHLTLNSHYTTLRLWITCLKSFDISEVVSSTSRKSLHCLIESDAANWEHAHNGEEIWPYFPLQEIWQQCHFWNQPCWTPHHSIALNKLKFNRNNASFNTANTISALIVSTL